MITLLALVLTALALPPQVDVLVVSDRSASLRHYNHYHLADEVATRSERWGDDYRVGVISCGTDDARGVPWLTPDTFTATSFHNLTARLTSADETCFNAIGRFLIHRNYLRNIPLLVYIPTDQPDLTQDQQDLIEARAGVPIYFYGQIP